MSSARRTGIATALGGRVNAANTGFYGHLFAYGVEPLAPLDFIIFSLFQSSQGVIFDSSGRRFADENRGDHNNTTAVAAQGGRALLLWSQAVQEYVATTPWTTGTPLMDRWAFSRDRGGRVTSAADARELLQLVREWGYELDMAVFDDDAVRERLGPARIFAAEVVPAVTMRSAGSRSTTAEMRSTPARRRSKASMSRAATLRTSTTAATRAGCARASVTGRRAGTKAAELATAATAA